MQKLICGLGKLKKGKPKLLKLLKLFSFLSIMECSYFDNGVCQFDAGKGIKCVYAEKGKQ